MWWSSTTWERMVSWIRFFVKHALFPALKRPRTYRKGSRTKKISLVRLTKDPSPSTKIEGSTREARTVKDDPDKVPTSHSEWQEQENYAYYSRIYGVQITCRQRRKGGTGRLPLLVSRIWGSQRHPCCATRCPFGVDHDATQSQNKRSCLLGLH